MKTIQDMDLKGKKVLIRCDFNVPIKDGKIIDDNRIVRSLETIKYAINQNAKVILLSHLGRVKEESDLEKNNLKPVAKRLSELLGQQVIFIKETRGAELETAINNLKEKEVLLVQNTRYEDLDGKKESGNDPELGKYWAGLGEVFINDAFGTAHRAHASNVGIASNLPTAAGFLIKKEIEALSSVKNPDKPFIVILGGSKVSDKIGVIKNLVTKADKILIGGGMAFTFLQAEGYDTASSIVDKDNLDFCKEVLKEHGEKIVLPVDFKVTKEFVDDDNYVIRDINEFEYNEMGLDIGEKTVDLFKNYLKDAKTVLWNGPLGVYEFSNFKLGTEEVLMFLVENNIKTILGGGDIVAAAGEVGLKDKVFHASTGGGATLEYLEGKSLPGIEVIK